MLEHAAGLTMQAVKLVTSAGLWRSLCLGAVRSRRHQVVQLCLDNMQDPLCARAIRSAHTPPMARVHCCITFLLHGCLQDHMMQHMLLRGSLMVIQ